MLPLSKKKKKHIENGAAESVYWWLLWAHIQHVHNKNSEGRPTLIHSYSDIILNKYKLC